MATKLGFGGSAAVNVGDDKGDPIIGLPIGPFSGGSNGSIRAHISSVNAPQSWDRQSFHADPLTASTLMFGGHIASVRGHEEVPAGGQVEVPAGAQ